VTPSKESLAASVEVVGEPWKDSAYYDIAERFTAYFWDADSQFRATFDRLDLTDALELACGHGRHAQIVAPMAGRLVLMDILEDNLAACRKRMAPFAHVQIVRNNGYDFEPVPARSLSAIYCYDSMVHFSPDLVASYLRDATRVLKPGGMALFHHSNFDADPSVHYGQNPHARNRMTMAMFAELANAAGLEIVESRTIDWGDAMQLDGLTLLRNP
jgi:SAM-dependent methyltransferase